MDACSSLALPVPDEIGSRLRQIRLDHWREYLNMDRCERLYRAAHLPEKANWFRARATVHILAVQTLNAFFPLGDTAERDHTSAAPVSSHETMPMDCGDAD